MAGLAAAKTYHQSHPEQSVLILDQNATLGGTWAKERLYPGLKTNNLVGPYQYPDFPLVPEEFGIKQGQHIPGQVVHDYLVRYTDRFGIADKIRYSVKVVRAKHHDDGGWTLTAVSEGETASFTTARLVVAAGLTSEAFLPKIEGEEAFGVPLFHSKCFLQYGDTLDTAESVTVFGGAKSAWDAVYAYASRGIKVHWVFRGQYLLTALCLSFPCMTELTWLRKRSWSYMASAAICNTPEEVAREAGKYPTCDLVQPMHMGTRRRLHRNQGVPKQNDPGAYHYEGVLVGPGQRRDHAEPV